MTAVLEAYRPLLMAVTFTLLGLAFFLTYRSAVKSRFMTANKIMLWTVTVVAAVFLFCPQYFNFSSAVAADGEFTDDMTRTVLTVEGMTCPG